MWPLLRLLQPPENGPFWAKRIWHSASLRYFNWSCSAIMESGPLEQPTFDFAIVSQLQHRDVVQYLVALKSFCQFCETPSEVHIINDGSLTEADQSLLRRQIPMLKLIDIASVDTGTCPRGGTWERLAYIVGNSKRIYTMQLDADTLTRGALPEVSGAIRQGRPFILGTDSGSLVNGSHTGERIGTFEEAAEFANKRLENHIQLRTERALPGLNMKERYYIRGCSAFAGFPVGAVNWGVAEDFSAQMRVLLEDGDDGWRIWGTEQITSNFLLANTENPVVLTEPAYLNFFRHTITDEQQFIHFLGTHRFSEDAYRRQALAFIAVHTES